MKEDQIVEQKTIFESWVRQYGIYAYIESAEEISKYDEKTGLDRVRRSEFQFLSLPGMRYRHHSKAACFGLVCRSSSLGRRQADLHRRELRS